MCIGPDDEMLALEQRHRDAMLELILAWGELDGALGILLSCVKGLPMDEGAELVGRSHNLAKLSAICKVLREAPGGTEAAQIMEKHKASYERWSAPRNRIAHSNCLGVWSQDQDFIVFLNFEKVGDRELAAYRVSVQEMQRAAKWGRAMSALATKLADAYSPVADSAGTPESPQSSKPA